MIDFDDSVCQSEDSSLECTAWIKVEDLLARDRGLYNVITVSVGPVFMCRRLHSNLC